MVRTQREFAGHLRDPENRPPPEGIEGRRLAIYRRLFFNSISNLMAKNFPVLRRLLDNAQWDHLIREFMVEHHATTPLFPEIGRELVRYLQELEQPLFPFMAELAHWEFLETTVRLSEASPEAACASDSLVVNPTVRLGIYHWPVHEIAPAFVPEQPLERPVILLAWRRLDEKVSFMRLNEVTARLIALIEENPGRQANRHFGTLATELDYPEPEKLERSGRAMLERLAGQEAVFGPLQ